MSVLHQDQALTQLMINTPPPNLSWMKIAPVTPVEKISDKYYVSGREEIYTGDITAQAMGTTVNESDQSQSLSSYTSKKWRHRMRITDEEMANQDTAVRAQLRRARQCKVKLNLAAEVRVKTLVYTTGSYASTAAATASWLTATWSQIEKDVQDAIERVSLYCDPTHIVIPIPYLYAIKRAQEAVRMYTDAQLVQQAIIGESVPFLSLQLIAAGAVNNTANPGQTDSIARVWSTSSAIAAVARIVPNPGLDEATWTQTFRWKGFGQENGGQGEQDKTYIDNDTQVTYVEHQMHQTEDVLMSTAATGITGI